MRLTDIWPVVEGVCQCPDPECGRASKHPRYNAPGSPDRPHAVFLDGLVVVDVDEREDAPGVGYASLAAAVPPVATALPPTRAVRTPTGGLHLYFAIPEGLDFVPLNDTRGATIGPKVDIKTGPSAYVVGPGSPGKRGGTYELDEDAPIAPCPSWLLERLRQRAATRSLSPAHRPTPVDLETPEGERRVRLGRELATGHPIARAGEDGHGTLFRLAVGLVRELQLPLETCLDLMAEHYSPRCEPPWTERELAHKVESAATASNFPTGYPTLEWEEMMRSWWAQPKAVRGMNGKAGERRVHDERHVCRYRVGEIGLGLDPKPVTFGALVDVFIRGEDWDGVWQYDAFARRVVCVDPPVALDAERGGLSEQDLSVIRCILEYGEVKAGASEIREAIHAAAKARTYHPLREYLASLPAGDARVLDGLAGRLFGDARPIADVSLRKWLVSCVARALRPGCKADLLLVLTGKGGYQKSTFAERLCPDPGLFADSLPSLDREADVIRQIKGKWIVELGELKNVRQSDVETVKAFLSRRIDRYTEKFEKDARDYPRECIFIGTSNDGEILADSTGNRRFLPIEVTREIDIAWLEEHRDEVWAAALDLYRRGHTWWFDAKEEALHAESVEAFEVREANHDRIKDILTGQKETRLCEVLEALGFDAGEWSRHQRSTTDTLRRLGCRHRLDPLTRRRLWVIPEVLAKGTPSKEELTRRGMLGLKNMSN